MRKSILIMALLCIFSLAATVAQAGPAPNLTNVKITHVGADNTGWIPAAQISTTTLYGEQFYIAVHFTGYPNPGRIFFYQDGHLIPPGKITEPFGRKGIGNPHSGWVYQFAMPVTYGNGTIAVQAEGIRGGTYYNTVYGVKTEYQPAK